MSWSLSFKAANKSEALSKAQNEPGSGKPPQAVRDYIKLGLEHLADDRAVDVGAYGHVYDGASIEETTAVINVMPK